jgi:hypothetical protein
MLERIDLRKAVGTVRKVLPPGIFVTGPARVALGRADTNGWYAHLGPLKAYPDLEIEVWLDASLKKSERGFWVGFGSEDKKSMLRLIDGVPVHLRPALTLHYADYSGEAPNLVLKPGPRPTDLSVPVYENYPEDEVQLYGIFFEPGQALDLSRAAGFLLEVLQTFPEVAGDPRNDPINIDVQIIESDPGLDETTRTQLIAARRGQGKYREELDQIWKAKCAVTQIAQRELLRASHIKAWRACENEEERLNPRNGLLLAAHLDALFDKYLISFRNNGAIILSRRLRPEVSKLLNLETHRIGSALSEQTQRYLGHHRDALRRADEAVSPDADHLGPAGADCGNSEKRGMH